MDDITNTYWAKVFRKEALQYSHIGRAILADYKRVKTDEKTIKLVRNT